MPLSTRALSRRTFGKLVTAAAGATVLGACATTGPPPPGTPLRVAAVNHVWSKALRKRLPEFEERIGRRVTMTSLTSPGRRGRGARPETPRGRPHRRRHQRLIRKSTP